MGRRFRLFGLGRRGNGGGNSPEYAVQFLGATDSNYGYINLDSSVVVSGDCSIFFKYDSYIAGFMVLGNAGNNSYVKINNSSIEVKANFSISNIPITTPAFGDVELRRIGTTMSIYIDGAFVTSATVSGNAYTFDSIGKNAANAVFFKAGQIRNVNINNQAIYEMNEGTGTLVADTSGNGNNGTFTTYAGVGGVGLPQWVEI